MAAVCGPLFGHAIGPLIAKRAAIGGQRRRSGAVPTSRVKIVSDKASGEARGAHAANASISEPFRRLPFCRTWPGGGGSASWRDKRADLGRSLKCGMSFSGPLGPLRSMLAHSI